MRLHGTVFSHSIHAVIAAHRDDLGDAEEAVAAAERELAATGPQLGSDWLGWASALVLEARGRPESSLAALGDAWDLCVDRGLASTLPLLAPDLVRLAHAADDRHRAERATTAIEELAARNPAVATLTGAALRCRGLLEDDPEVLVRAVAAYKSGPRPLELALTCEDAAWRLGRSGRVGEARPLFDDALSLYERLGASWDLARAAARLRGLGIRPGRRGPRRRPRSGWDSLTATELTVVRLVAEGLSNPGDRRPDVHLPGHGPHPCLPHPGQARARLTRRAGRRGQPAWPLSPPAARPGPRADRAAAASQRTIVAARRQRRPDPPPGAGPRPRS